MKQRTPSLFLALCAGLASSPLAAQDWSMHAATGPTSRQLPRMVFDTARNQTVLFGGYLSSTSSASDETWLFDGSKWTLATPASSPSKRDTFAFCYDSARGVAVLFGGVDSSNFPSSIDDQTWEWNGVRWLQRTPPAAPSARFGAELAYDSARKVSVLFGGSTATSRPTDTWEWNGAVWRQVTTSNAPSARTNHNMVYDVRRQRVVLFGGTTTMDDTWEYDGVDWTRVQTPTSPPARTGASMAYDFLRGRCVLFGGRSSAGLLNDTWEYDGSNWYRYQLETKPAARTNHAMTYALQRRACVLWGGALNFADTWELGGDDAAFTAYGSSCSGSAGRAVMSVTSLPKLGGSFDLTLSTTPNNAVTVWLLGLGGTQLLPVPGCGLLTPPHVANATVASGSTATLKIPVPSTNTLRGVILPMQAAVLDSGAALGFVLSNAGRAVLGS